MNALIGGIILGISALILFTTLGRILGISGICGSLLNYTTLKENKWRILFLTGMIISAIAFKLFLPNYLNQVYSRPIYLYAIAGLLVGIGTQVANGCTSGHAICGISRFSIRSIAATCTFIIFGILTVLVLNMVGL